MATMKASAAPAEDRHPQYALAPMQRKQVEHRLSRLQAPSRLTGSPSAREEVTMKQLMLATLGWIVASTVHAETYSFSVVTGSWHRSEQTLINCLGPAQISGRIPSSCTLSEPAQAYPNHKNDRGSSGVTCAPGHRIAFHPTGTLAECVLADEQWVDQTEFSLPVPGLASCKGRVRFDASGEPNC
jgi:hypothetical protein